jgi:hypothetical protein
VTALVWDGSGDHQYETGIDRGVLYLTDGSAVAWNGLTSVVESRSRDLKSYFLDGIKYQDRVIPGAYSARLSAYTYPDELDALMGNAQYAQGVTLYDQRSSMFNLSYRTRIGNDVFGSNYAERIHIVYNLVAIPSDVTNNTIGEAAAPEAFEWELSGTPISLDWYRPANHISVDSREMDPIALVGLEHVLYGTETDDPSLPSFEDLLALVSS